MFFLGVWTGFWLALAWDAWVESLYEPKPLPNRHLRIADQGNGKVSTFAAPHWPRDGGP